MEVPVIRAGFLNDTDRRAFALAENRLAELSEFDGELLAEELEFLFKDGFDIETIDFSTSDLDFAIVEEEEEEKPAQPEHVELPAPEEVAVSRLGRNSVEDLIPAMGKLVPCGVG